MGTYLWHVLSLLLMYRRDAGRFVQFGAFEVQTTHRCGRWCGWHNIRVRAIRVAVNADRLAVTWWGLIATTTTTGSGGCDHVASTRATMTSWAGQIGHVSQRHNDRFPIKMCCIILCCQTRPYRVTRNTLQRHFRTIHRHSRHGFGWFFRCNGAATIRCRSIFRFPWWEMC